LRATIRELVPPHAVIAAAAAIHLNAVSSRSPFIRALHPINASVRQWHNIMWPESRQNPR
jgi:hypothetical protein